MGEIVKSNKLLSEDEFKNMINLIHRYAELNMDQWELWKFDTSRGEAYVKISMKSDGPDEAYSDLDHLIEN